MSLALFHTDSRDLTLLQTSWSTELNPVLANPLVNGIFRKGIALINGVTTINHLLGRKQQGFIITDINGAALVYRSLPFNNLTLTLTSNATVTVDLYIF